MLYNSFESKATPEAKVIANKYLNKLLAMDEQFADVEKEKTKWELEPRVQRNIYLIISNLTSRN